MRWCLWINDGLMMVNDNHMFHFSHCSSKSMNGAASPVVVVSPCGELRSL